MFRTSCVHHQEDFIVRAVLYVMLFMNYASSLVNLTRLTLRNCSTMQGTKNLNFAKKNSKFCLIHHLRLVFITEVESVYSAVRTESYNTDTFRP